MTAFAPAAVKPPIDQATLDKIDVRVGTILSVGDVPETDRLALLTVDFGDHTRSIVAGIRTERRDVQSIVGAQTLFVVNLQPRIIRGQRSEGMLFDAGFADGLRPALMQPESPVPAGTRVG